MATGIGAQKQALVGALRNITALTAVVGSGGIHEGVVLRGTDYPFVVYDVVYSARSYEWGDTSTMRTGFDVVVVSNDQVQAHNLDSLIIDGLHDASLNLGSSGQTSLFCRRVADLSFADFDSEGNKVYQVGGTYAVWTAQTM